MQFGDCQEIKVVSSYFPSNQYMVKARPIICDFPFELMVHKCPDSSRRWRVSERSTGWRLGNSFKTRRESAEDVVQKVKNAGIEQTKKCIATFNIIN